MALDNTSGPAAKLGQFTRSGRKRISALPGLSAVVDLAVARHCVDLLAEQLKAAPADPRHHVWLAEALASTRRDLRKWTHMRTVIEPWSLLTRFVLGRAAQLGTDADTPTEPAEVVLLRRAFTLAGKRVRDGRGDAQTLHVLARIYLAQNQPAHALHLAGAALRLPSDERAEVLVTAARALQRLRRRAEAEQAATGAIQHGSTVGYAVLARLRATDPSGLTGDPRERARVWNELRRNVRCEDRARYFGAARTSREIADAAGAAQWRKAGTTLGEVVELATRTTKELRK